MERFVYIRTFGCQMNVYDSERLLQVLAPLSYAPTDDPSRADLILVNTCTVRETAAAKVRAILGRYAPLKDMNPDLLIGVAGCVAQQEGAALLRRVPYVDLVIGPDAIPKLPELLARVRETRERTAETELHKQRTGYEFLRAEPVHDGRPSAMVTVMKGCNKGCSYCIVPRVRGREISKPAGDVVREVERFVASGVREVTLLGQNVNSYGHDRNDGVLFPDLLRSVHGVEGLARLRFTTSHPWDCTDELCDCFSSLPKLCEYLHLPIQSGSDAVLDAMRRGYTREQYMDRVRRLRRASPGLHISTDFIVGFPGETEADFEQTLEVIDEARFDFVFGFKYSERQGTSAARLSDDVAPDVKAARLSAVFERALVHRRARLAELDGQVVEVLVEGPSKQSLRVGRGGSQLTGRTRTNLVVNFPTPPGVHAHEMLGTLVDVEVRRALPHSLYGEVAGSR